MYKPFSRKLRAEDVGALINFGVENHAAQTAMHNIQTAGAAAIWNMLTEKDFAYLADEVGMGKTYQALGVMSLLWNFDPKARIVIVCPRSNLQAKWSRDYTNFVRHNYRAAYEGGDDKVKSILLDQPVIDAVKCENLREFAEQLQAGVDGEQLFILRHTSFTRPLRISEDDKRAAVSAWRRETTAMAQYGIHLGNHIEEIKQVNADDITKKFNEWFGRAVNRILANFEHSGREKAIDLLIVDEAQCLRNKNHRNITFEHLFKGRVGKTLFLSATPIHSGRGNVKSVINKYGAPDYITDADIDDANRMRSKLKQFMIRRPREYDVPHGGEVGGPAKWTKDKYRDHNQEDSRIITMTPLESLVMATVQKNLVGILDAKNNRFKIGCLSCFESLQASVYNSKKSEQDAASEEADPTLPDSDKNSDVYTSHHDKESREIKKEVPDMRFVDKLSRSYSNTFGEKYKIPHPKVDFIVRALTEHSILGGHKFVVFTRRINTVAEIVARLNEAHDKWVRQHIKAAWGYEFSQLPGLSKVDTVALVSGDDESEGIEGDSLLARAARKGRWLYKYRQTFREAGRNALMFEENWFRYFSETRNIDIAEIGTKIPKELWAESWEYAVRSKNTKNPKIFPADRYQYLLVQTVKRSPGILGLTGAEAGQWLAFFLKRYPDAVKAQQATVNTESRADQLVTFTGFWDILRSRCRTEPAVKDVFGKLYPGIDPSDIKFLFRREITKNCVWQSIRLGESLFDLYCCDVKATDFTVSASGFIDYMFTHKEAGLLHAQIKEWIDQIEVIILNSLSSEGQSLEKLAAGGKYTELNNPQFAVGIVGGDTNKTALSQFKTPGYPRVIVCTDILKEGEDLHVFCDKVVHYGVAWTSGDLEQRVGRVDRYFSQIERRLLAAPAPQSEKLEILYPHLVNSIEKRQVDMVMERVKDAEKILDDIGNEPLDESKEVDLNLKLRPSVRPASAGPKKHYEPNFAGVSSLNIEREFPVNCRAVKNNYLGIHRAITSEFHSRQYLTDPESVMDQFSTKVYLENDRENYDCVWDYIPSIRKYSFRIRRELDEADTLSDAGYICAYRERDGKEYRRYIEQRVLIDMGVAPEKAVSAVHAAMNYLHAPETRPLRDPAAAAKLKKLLCQEFGQIKHKKHYCKLKFKLCGKIQRCQVRAYADSYLIISPIAHDNIVSIVDTEDEIADINAQRNFGFLCRGNDGVWYFCERVFQAGLDIASLPHIVERVAHIAYQYRLKILGN